MEALSKFPVDVHSSSITLTSVTVPSGLTEYSTVQLPSMPLVCARLGYCGGTVIIKMGSRKGLLPSIEGSLLDADVICSKSDVISLGAELSVSVF